MKLTTCNEYFTDWPIEEVFSTPPTSDTKPSRSLPLPSPTASKTSPRRAAPKSALPPNALAWKSPACTGSWPVLTGYTSLIPTQLSTSAPGAYFKELVQFCGDLGAK